MSAWRTLTIVRQPCGQWPCECPAPSGEAAEPTPEAATNREGGA